jgi:hypothetical protein
MCHVLRKYKKCIGCRIVPNCYNTLFQNDSVIECDAFLAGRIAECPTGGEPDPDDPADVRAEYIGGYYCRLCRQMREAAREERQEHEAAGGR